MYAGTRFLKRGTNFEGDVANEVETEQIVFDSDRADLPDGRFSSFVQVRGSIPLMWSQDVSTRAPRPPISIYLNDPYATAAGRHFNRLLKRHGSPILILDLTKRNETRNFESSLGPHFRQLVNQLNISALPYFALDYRSLDMAHLNKRPKDNAMKYLFLFSTWALKKTGVFFTPSTPRTRGPATPVHQTGTVRVNCVDCLDRTNTAQFALAKCALANQLYVMGVLTEPHIPWDSDCSRVLEDLYEDHGDTMALQYGGSQLVHRIQTYRHTAKWSSHGSDMMQSLSRYYSNRFSDLEKQQSFNVFLGFYVPHRESTPLWEMSSDYALHNPRMTSLPLQPYVVMPPHSGV
ncbi:SAC domain [Trinorchestia longiramus]|nr:SAC domain [Trinorchestia longiramus]